jgi:hypothetical protein
MSFGSSVGAGLAGTTSLNSMRAVDRLEVRPFNTREMCWCAQLNGAGKTNVLDVAGARTSAD